MRTTFQWLLFACTLLFVFSCKKSDDARPASNTVAFAATLSGASEVPANASTATGSASITYNTITKIMTVVVTYSGLTATAAHIHQGAAGANGSVIFPFASPVTSPINYTSIALDATQEATLYANGYYVNVHSATYGGGEIRGQIIKQ